MDEVPLSVFPCPFLTIDDVCLLFMMPGYSAARWSKEEGLQFPCPGNYHEHSPIAIEIISYEKFETYPDMHILGFLQVGLVKKEQIKIHGFWEIGYGCNFMSALALVQAVAWYNNSWTAPVKASSWLSSAFFQRLY